MKRFWFIAFLLVAGIAAALAVTKSQTPAKKLAAALAQPSPAQANAVTAQAAGDGWIEFPITRVRPVSVRMNKRLGST